MSDIFKEDKPEKLSEKELVDKANSEFSTVKQAYVVPQETFRHFPEEFSPTIGKLAGALAIAQGAMKNIIKGKQGYGYKYAPLDALLDMARDPLANNNLAIIQTHELVKGKNPSVVTHTTLAHESGEWMRSSIELPIANMPQLSPAQVIGVNCTYGRRYAIQALLLVAGEDDSDGASPIELK
ncbi:MAG TPA: ERF family protein [Candidatus Nanoarchaeia archaeon]|nr:ERF family protein [Candidatus Nanoarchaeia archaeon]